MPPRKSSAMDNVPVDLLCIFWWRVTCVTSSYTSLSEVYVSSNVYIYDAKNDQNHSHHKL